MVKEKVMELIKKNDTGPVKPQSHNGKEDY
jgi:hypothetical protein